VFISYRRQEAGPYARLLREELSRRLGGDQMFMDVDSIEVAVDFAEAVQRAVDNTLMPRRQQLPDSLAPLARRNALELTYNRYEYELDGCWRRSRRWLANRPHPPHRHRPSPPTRAVRAGGVPGRLWLGGGLQHRRHQPRTDPLMTVVVRAVKLVCGPSAAQG
jgi:hypothetical protein